MSSRSALFRGIPARRVQGGNRRSEPRVELELDVDVRLGDVCFTGFSSNVSRRGIQFGWHSFTGRAPRMNERFELRFSLPGIKEPISAKAEVRWTRTRGVGAEFVEIAPESRRMIEDFVDLRAPLAA